MLAAVAQMELVRAVTAEANTFFPTRLHLKVFSVKAEWVVLTEVAAVAAVLEGTELARRQRREAAADLEMDSE
jgi:hypothetical protein